MTDRADNQTRLALVVAALALAIALGGIAVAAGPPLAKAIKGTAVKKGSEPGNRLIADSVTGKEVKESTLGQVAKATAADTADSAATAGHADSATTASSADTVGGRTAASLQVSCPAGTVASSDVCIETGAARPAATWTAAQIACSAAGGRTLPTPAELEQFRVSAGQPGVEWANSLFNNTTAYTINMTNGAAATSAIGTPQPFRCVVGASN
jgi:hypothetical protein